MDDWTRLLEDGGQIDVIYTDLEKAFVKVPHKYLLQKLERYDIDRKLLKWIKAFLTERKQRVRICDSYSQWTEVISGIPQGSVLGPILFIIYINDLTSICNINGEIFLYADDTKIYKYVTSRQEADQLQKDITKIVDWFNRNLLSLNVNN